MATARYSINVTLDGCCHHEEGLPPDAESMAYWTAGLREADAMILGRVTYEMMEAAWRRPDSGVWPDWMSTWEVPFAETIDGIKKYVASSTLESPDWNAELLAGPLDEAVRELKERVDGVLAIGGVALPTVLAELGLIDEYEFVVHPVVAGRGPRLLAGLQRSLHLKLVERRGFASGATLERYRPVK